jgi:hypothetical protein
MFQTLTGSLIILFCIVAILIGFAVFLTALLRWIFGKDRDVVAIPEMPSKPYSLRRAA